VDPHVLPDRLSRQVLHAHHPVLPAHQSAAAHRVHQALPAHPNSQVAPVALHHHVHRAPPDHPHQQDSVNSTHGSVPPLRRAHRGLPAAALRVVPDHPAARHRAVSTTSASVTNVSAAAMNTALSATGPVRRQTCSPVFAV
jgi:hypothetical protein